MDVVTIEILPYDMYWISVNRMKKSWKVLILLGLISSFSLFLWVNEQNLLRPKFTHSIRFSTENLKIVRDYSKILDDAWVVTADSKGIIYTSGNNDIASFDSNLGKFLWKTKPPGFYYPDWLIFGDDGLFGTTALGIEVYDVNTGRWKWSIEIGSGHVRVIPQLDGKILRVYYGDSIVDIKPDSGEILNKEPRDNLEWIQGNVELFRVSPDRISGRNRDSGKEIWQVDGGTFNVIEFSPIEYTNENLLLMDFLKKVCLLDITSGQYLWCHSDNFASNVAILKGGKIGYFLRQDFTLEKFDIASGDTLAETQFSPESDSLQSAGVSFVSGKGDNEIIVLFQDNKQLVVLKNK